MNMRLSTDSPKALREIEVSSCPRCSGTHKTVMQILVGDKLGPFNYIASCPVVEQMFFVGETETGDLVLENEVPLEQKSTD